MMITHLGALRSIHNITYIRLFGSLRARSWVAVKELNLSCYVVGTILVAIDTHYGKLIQVP